MSITTTIAAAAIATVASVGVAQASINPVHDETATLEATIAPEFVSTASADVDAFIKMLERQADDGTLSDQDIRKVRRFQENASVDVDALTERLKRQADDGTLSDQDLLRIRLQTASADVDAFIKMLERQADDGTLSDQDIRKVRRFQQNA